MGLDEAMLMHDWLIVSRDSLQQQIEGLLQAYPGWRLSGNKSKVEEHLDKACLQHNMIIAMEKAFKEEIEKKNPTEAQKNPKT